MLLALALLAGLTVSGTQAAPKLAEKLDKIRTRVIDLERELLATARQRAQTQKSVSKIQEIMRLQQEESVLTGKRVAELNSAVQSLEARRQELRARMDQRREAVRKSLASLLRTTPEYAQETLGGGGELPEQWRERERVAMPARKVIAAVTDLSLKEIEAFRVDLSDAESLERRLQEERAQLVYLAHDLDEQRNVLELNRQIQMSILAKNHEEKLARLAAYNSFKSAESKVETLLTEFNARAELTRTMEAERQLSRGEFASLRGRLALPLAGGSIVSSFGQVFDPKVKMSVFRKGVEIAPAAANAGNQDARQVRAIAAGKIAFSGELPDYGKVAIVDHGDHYYTLLGRMGEVLRRTGDAVSAGEVVGSADAIGTPVYFEVRMRNVAVNPLQWVVN